MHTEQNRGSMLVGAQRLRIAWTLLALPGLVLATLCACAETTHAPQRAVKPDAAVASQAHDSGTASDSGTAADTGTAAPRAGLAEEVTIGPDLTACQQHTDCALVETGCNGCCQTGAIAIGKGGAFRVLFES